MEAKPPILPYQIREREPRFSPCFAQVRRCERLPPEHVRKRAGIEMHSSRLRFSRTKHMPHSRYRRQSMKRLEWKACPCSTRPGATICREHPSGTSDEYRLPSRQRNVHS